MSIETQREYQVVGMTCDHCVASVVEEVSAVDGVTGAHAELAGGRLVVKGGSVSDDDVRAAVAEAGYEVAG